MGEKDRPGVLTAMAVINFIVAAWTLFVVLATVLGRIFISSIPMDQMTEAQVAQVTAFENMSGSTLATIICIGTITFLLLLLSGIGYLKQKKVMGRVLGSSYGLLRIIYVIVTTLILPGVFGGSFGIMSAVVLIYPVLTLILLNTVYKDDLIY